MKTLCGTILAAAVAAVAAAAPLAEYPGEVGEKTGWKCVGSEEGKVVYIPFEGYYESKGGRIESPRFKLDGEVGKNRFYRLEFSAKCPVDGYWWVDFFDKDGIQLPDVNSRLYASEDWMAYDVVVPAHPAAAFAQIAFVARKGALAKDVTMRRASVAEAAKWCNDLAARLPKLDAPETKGAWDGLPKTRTRILSGKPVNIVFLGDSIMNDTWCGNAVALIQDALPKADLRCYLSVRGSTGCWYYHEKDHFAEYVGKYKPDLVVIGGISNYGGPAYHSLKEVEDCMVETILRCQLIGAEVVICTPPPSYEFRKDAAAKPFDRSLLQEKDGFLYLQQEYERRAAQRAGAQVWDLTTAPCEAIARSGKPLDWFKRDAAHNDDRGKQLIARTLAAYFRFVANSRAFASQTAELQARIDEVWRRGGGEVVLDAGTHELASVRLRSGITLRLKADAKILASTNVEDYVGTLLRDKVEPVARETLEHAFGENLTRRSQYALFHALQAHDIVVVGEPGSSIDGRNCFDALGAEGYRGPHAFSFVATTNVVFRGIAVENAGDYAYKFVDSRNVVLDGAKAVAGHDGVHFDLCNEVSILNGCFLTGDDSVAGSGCCGIVIPNCTLSSACSAIRLGGRDVLVTDCRIVESVYPHRWTLTREEKTRGANPSEVGGGVVVPEAFTRDIRATVRTRTSGRATSS